MHGDEQQANMRVHNHITEALEHAVAVVVGERQLRGVGNAHESRHATLKRAIGPPLRIGGRQEKMGCAFDESLVVFTERSSGKLFFEAVGNASAIETVLQLTISLVEHDAHGVAPSSSAKAEPARTPSQILKVAFFLAGIGKCQRPPLVVWHMLIPLPLTAL